ncbi:hypothetical protein BGW42_006077, partial [Actinomortierella wolfii]
MPTPPLPVSEQADSSGTPSSPSSTTSAIPSVTATIAASTSTSTSMSATPPLSVPLVSASLGLMSATLPAPTPTHTSSPSSVPLPSLPSSRSPQLLDRLVQAANRAKTHVGDPVSPLVSHPEKPPPSTEVVSDRSSNTSPRERGSSVSGCSLDRPLPPLPPRNMGEDAAPTTSSSSASIAGHDIVPAVQTQGPIQTTMPDLRSSLDQDDPFPDTATDLPEISMLNLESVCGEEPLEREKALPQTPQPTTLRPTESTRLSLTPQQQQGYAVGQSAPPDVVVAPPTPLLPPPAVTDQYSPASYPPSNLLSSNSSNGAPPLSFSDTGYDPLPPARGPGAPFTERQDQQDPPPSYIAQAGNRGSMIIAQAPTEDQMFEVSVLSQPLANSSSSNSSSGSSSSSLHLSSSPPLSSASLPSSPSSSSSSAPHQFISASPMHDQQYLLLGCANALHSIDLTLPAHERKVRTHIQGVSFKEIHCLEDIGLVVVIAGRNNRVRCYDYESIKKLVAYGHSKEGCGRVVEGGRLGPVKHKIQLRVETALLSSSAREGGAVPPGGPNSSPLGKTSRFLHRASYHPGQQQQQQPLPPQLPPRQQQWTPPPAISTHEPAKAGGRSSHVPGHRHTTSLDRNLLSPLDAESPFSADTAGAVTSKSRKARPLSFGALASLTQGKSKDLPPLTFSGASTATAATQPSGAGTGAGVSPGGGGQEPGNTSTKGKRFAQVASYLTQAAASSHLVVPAQDRPSEEAMDWAWDFIKLRHTKDVMSLDFHYTPTTVFMTVLSKSGIDIFRRPKSARGIARSALRASRGNSREGSDGSGGNGLTGGTSGSGAGAGSATGTAAAQGEIQGHRTAVGGMATATAADSSMATPWYTANFDTSRNKQEKNPHDWEPYKQFYHPEPPSFMTVVKNSYAVTDIILGKGPRACVIHVEDMSVRDLYRNEPTPSMFQGPSKKLGFRLSYGSGGLSMSSYPSHLWHSFEKIPYDVPAHVLYPDTVDALYGTSSPGNSYRHPQPRRRSSIGGSEVDYHRQQPAYQQHPAFTMSHHASMRPTSAMQLHPYHEQDNNSCSSSSSSPGSSSSSSSPSWYPQQPPQQQQYSWAPYASPLPPQTTAMTASSAPSATRKARMVTSDQVLNMAFSRPTTKQLFLATYGTQSRIVDLTGKPVSPIVIDWGAAHVPQKIEFLRTAYDIYVVGFERSRIMIYSLTRAVKVKEITRSGSTWSFEILQQRQQQQQQQTQQQPSAMLQGMPEGSHGQSHVPGHNYG